MGQLERYGLYVLVVVIFLILGVAIMGGEPNQEVGGPTPSQLAIANGGTRGPDPSALEEVSPAERLRGYFSGSDAPIFVDAPPRSRPISEPDPDATDRTDPGTDPGSDPVGRIGGGSGPGGPVAVPQPAPRTHTIVAGDSFAKIASDVLGDERLWVEIARLNPRVDPNKLKLGTVVQLPAPAAAPVADTRPALPAGARIHVVKAGEVLGTIAKEYYGRTTEWRRIAAANEGLEPTRMQAGTRLVIPPLE